MNKTTVHDAILRDDANRRLVAFANYNADINAASVAYNTTLAPSPNDATCKKTYDDAKERLAKARSEYEDADITYAMADTAAADIHNATVVATLAYVADACDTMAEAAYVKATADRAARDAYEAADAVASAIHDTFRDAYERACQEFYDASYAIYEAKMKKF